MAETLEVKELAPSNGMTALVNENHTHPKDVERLWRNPTAEYRMKTWWFFGYERTADEGIIADVEALRDAGFGGVVYYDQVHGPAEGALDAFSPEWWEMLKFAALVGTGGEAKMVIADGLVGVNGETCTMRGKKIYPGDKVDFQGYTLEVTKA